MAKKIVIISGKGGTGKTFISAALCAIGKNKVIVDADVDAADLFLLLNPITKEIYKFSGGYKALIDENLCIKCGNCYNVCHFEAINKNFFIDDILCEGCGFCAKICPNNAIEMQPANSGEWYISETQYGSFVHAKLGIAEENSGKLVSLIKYKATEIADKNKCEWIIIDGPPGIGCSVIACLSGADIALVVTEPTLSGLEDAKRVIEVAKHFSVQINLVINKYDLNEKMTDLIEQYCLAQSIPIIGKIKFDSIVVSSIVNGKNIMELPDANTGEIKQVMEKIWKSLIKK